MHNPEITIVAPMFNESANVLNTLAKLKDALTNLGVPFEIVFVNDGSTDNTLKVCEEARKSHPELHIESYDQNRGRGYALKRGFSTARGNFVFAIDFDLSYDVSHVIRMYENFKADESIDIILVSAYMPGGATDGVPPFRLAISRLGNRLLSFAFNQKVYTSTCVVRGYKRKVIQSMVIDSIDKDIHLEILSRAFALGYKVVEIPGTLRRRIAGKSKFKFKKTSQSHLEFLFLERPAKWMGKASIYCFASATAAGIFLTLGRVGYLPSNDWSLTSFVSPAVVIVLILISMFLGVSAIVATLVGSLRREILKVQSMLATTTRHD